MSSENDRGRASDRSDAIEELLGNAAPRPVPPADDEQAVRAAVLSEWKRVTDRRAVWRRAASYGLAASVVVAVLAGLALLRAPGVAQATPVAAIAKEHGTVQLAGDPAETSGTVFVGQTLTTEDGAGVALAWRRGGSLRIDEDSRVRFDSPSSIHLLAGRIYFDSVTDPLSQVRPPGGPARLVVETSNGVLRHLGTQFIAEVDGDSLNVLVREGAVRLERNGVLQTAAAGQGIRVVGAEAGRVSAVSGSGVRWEWVQRLSPPVDLRGRSARDALRWVGRETGLDIRFGTRSAQRAAESAEWRGLEELGRMEPLLALDLIVSGAGLQWRSTDGVVVVSEHDGA